MHVPVSGEGRRTLLAFLSSGCSVCRTFWDELSTGDADVPGGARLAVVTKGPEEESASRLRLLAGPRLEVVRSSAAWSDYGVPGSPYFVYVEDGVITGEGSSTTWAQVRDLMGQAVDDAAAARELAARQRSSPGRTPYGRTPAGTTPHGQDAVREDAVRDDVGGIDRELLRAGIHPGHPSLYEPPEAPDPGAAPPVDERRRRRSGGGTAHGGGRGAALHLVPLR